MQTLITFHQQFPLGSRKLFCLHMMLDETLVNKGCPGAKRVNLGTGQVFKISVINNIHIMIWILVDIIKHDEICTS